MAEKKVKPKAPAAGKREGSEREAATRVTKKSLKSLKSMKSMKRI